MFDTLFPSLFYDYITLDNHIKKYNITVYTAASNYRLSNPSACMHNNVVEFGGRICVGYINTTIVDHVQGHCSHNVYTSYKHALYYHGNFAHYNFAHHECSRLDNNNDMFEELCITTDTSLYLHTIAT